jgi:hypothetical protein
MRQIARSQRHSASLSSFRVPGCLVVFGSNLYIGTA